MAQLLASQQSSRVSSTLRTSTRTGLPQLPLRLVQRNVSVFAHGQNQQAASPLATSQDHYVESSPVQGQLPQLPQSLRNQFPSDAQPVTEAHQGSGMEGQGIALFSVLALIGASTLLLPEAAHSSGGGETLSGGTLDLFRNFLVSIGLNWADFAKGVDWFLRRAAPQVHLTDSWIGCTHGTLCAP